MSNMVNFLQQDKNSIVINHFCTYVYPATTQYTHILRSIALELIRADDELINYAYERYLLSRKPASAIVLEQMISELLPAFPSQTSRTTYVRLLLDGLDECDEETQQRVFRFLNRIVDQPSSSVASQTVCKVLISSQETRRLAKVLSKKTSVRLEEESEFMSASIRSYTQFRLKEIRLDWLEHDISDNDIKFVEDKIVEKSEGIQSYKSYAFIWLTSMFRYVFVGPYDLGFL